MFDRNKGTTLADYASKMRDAAAKFEYIADLFNNPAFVLTGSRRFGTNTEYSDYDYFIKSSIMELGLSTKLEILGFHRKYSFSLYSDPSINYIMELDNLIDLQVVHDNYYDAKVASQESFAKLVHRGVIVGLSKRELRDIWTNLILVEK